jgi:hypothetical protein
MTYLQSEAIWELCRQGLHGEADEAERHWTHGETFRLGQYLRVPRWVSGLIDQCNWEVKPGEFVQC